MSPSATTINESDETLNKHCWDLPFDKTPPRSSLEPNKRRSLAMETAAISVTESTNHHRNSRLGGLLHSHSHSVTLQRLDTHPHDQRRRSMENNTIAGSRRLGRSFGGLFRHLQHSWPQETSTLSPPLNTKSHQSSSFNHVNRLESKYGPYIKPIEKKKHLGGNRKNIASGATAVIRLVQPRDSSSVLAVKEFIKKDKNEDERTYRKRMQNEYCISKSARGHPHVVETMDLVLDEHDRWCAVMEYCAGGDLFSLLEERPSLSTMEQSCLFKQLLLGLQHLHSLGIAHRDIKPENLVMTTGGTLKIADFGVAHVVQTCFEKQAHPCHEWCGSANFWSPEMWSLKSADDAYDGQALDMWSAAVTYYCIRFRSLPFKCSFYRVPPLQNKAVVGSPAMVAAAEQGDADYQHYIDQRQVDPLQCDLWLGPGRNQQVDMDLRDCLSHLMDPDPKTRWTVHQALDCDWLNKVEMCDDGKLVNGWRHYHCAPKAH